MGRALPRVGLAMTLAWAAAACGTTGSPTPVEPVERGAPPAVEPPPPPPLEAPRLAAHVRAITEAFDAERAHATVAYVERYFRVRGNEGYVKTLERVVAELEAGGFDAAHLRTLSLGETQDTWTPRAGRVTLLGEGGREEDLLRFDTEAERDRATLLVGSDALAPTVLEVVRAEQVAQGTPAAGRLVLATGEPDEAFAMAQAAGARGILVRNLEPYHRAEENPDAAQFGYLPAHEGEAVGFSLSHRAHERLLVATRGGPARVRVSVSVVRGRGAAGAVEARIDGTRANGAIVFVAHVDEPGANDNASGVGALAELARALRAAITSGALPRPARPIVFLWGQEMEIAASWLESSQATPGAGLVLDMVGQDPAIVGAPFLVERMPDPGAIWLRAPDAHSEWGQSEVSEAQLRGHFLNALASAAAAQVAASSQATASQATFTWRDHPYEGGSDHVPFLERGLPAVLGWHFTDSAYHTSLDRIDRVSAAEMERVAAAFGALGVTMASESDEDLEEILGAVTHHAYTRLRDAHAAARDASDAALERRIVEAWIRWYEEAFTTVAEWPADPRPAAGHAARVEEARARWRATADPVAASIR